MTAVARHVCRRVVPALAPRFALPAGRYGILASRFGMGMGPPARCFIKPRGITMTATVPAHEGVRFEELLVFLEVQYGLAESCVRSSLAELAEILGYHASVNTIIRYSDAHILLEEIGAPPLTPEEFGKFKASRIDRHKAEEDVRADRRDTSMDNHADEHQLPIIQPVQSCLPAVSVSYPPRLFRGR